MTKETDVRAGHGHWLDHALGRAQYEPVKIIGRGSYGTVWSCKHREDAAPAPARAPNRALKKIKGLFDVKLDTIRVLRELQFLRLLRHPCIIHATDVLIPTQRNKFNEVNIVFALYDTDLSRLIRSPTVYAVEHVRWIIYQILQSLRYLHSLNVFHRDIKPGNILLNADCDVKLCDFGLARAKVTGADTQAMFWSDYVCSRWYRAPELICCHTARNAGGVDMWSAGCILAELFRRKPIFRGSDSADQLREICQVVGHPSKKVIDGVTSDNVREFLREFEPEQELQTLESRVPQADHIAQDLLHDILKFDPAQRIDAATALKHVFFEDLVKLPAAKKIEKFYRSTVPPKLEHHMQASSQLKNKSVSALRECIYEEIMRYHVRTEEEGGTTPVRASDSSEPADASKRRMSCTAAREPMTLGTATVSARCSDGAAPVTRARSHSDTHMCDRSPGPWSEHITSAVVGAV